MNQIYFTGLVSGFRINIRHHTIRCNLNTLNGIGQHISCHFVKVIDFAIFADQNLLQRIGNPDSFHNIRFHSLRISHCIESRLGHVLCLLLTLNAIYRSGKCTYTKQKHNDRNNILFLCVTHLLSLPIL